MSDVPDRTLAADPIVRALAAAIREVAARKAAAEGERRRNLSVVGPTSEGGKAA